MDKSSNIIPEAATKTKLRGMKRSELEEVAVSLGVPNPNTIKNKEQLVTAICEQQEIVTVDKEEQLTPKQEEFCRIYATESEFFGNGVQSYIEAYNINLAKPGAYDAARVSAHHLLTNPNILKRINEHLEEIALNDTHVDKQMAFLITQNADFNAKNQAIKEYNKLKKRVDSKLAEGGNTYHLTQNNFSFGTPDGEEIADNFLQSVLEQTKGKLVGRTANRQTDPDQAGA